MLEKPYMVTYSTAAARTMFHLASKQLTNTLWKRGLDWRADLDGEAGGAKQGLA